MPALSPNSLVVVTGITGYVGSHVGLAALKAGHRVRGTVRSIERAQSLKDGYIKHGVHDVDTRLEFVLLDDLLSIDQYLRALDGVDGAVHVAVSMDLFGSYEFVKKAPEITNAFLRAAKQVPSLKRVVITSTMGTFVSPPTFIDHPLTENDWNHDVLRIVEQEMASGKTDISPFNFYGAGKTKAEMGAWTFIEENNPHFDLVSVCPNLNFGPVVYGPAASTSAWIQGFLQNDGTMMHICPPQWWIDVRDNAKLHVLSLTTPSVSGKRIIAVAAPFGWNQVLTVLRKRFPGRQLPEDVPGKQGEPDPQKMDNSIATEMLGSWIGLEQSVVDFAASVGL